MDFYINPEMNTPSYNAKFLTIDGSNYMRRELQIIPGTNEFPGLCVRGDNKTGMYWFSQGTLGLSSRGWTMFTFGNKTLTFFDRSSNKVNLVMPLPYNSTELNINLPDTSGTLALRDDFFFTKTNNEMTDTLYPGMAVKLNDASGVVKANATYEATYAIGMCMSQADASESVTVIFSGLYTLADWTQATGSTDLIVGETYYLSDTDSGMLVTTPPTNTQRIGIAVTEKQMLLKIS